MNTPLLQHRRRLYLLHAGAAVLSAAAGLVAYMVRPLPAPRFAQTAAILGVLATIGAMNLLTLLPVVRAMVASPRRVFAVSADLAPLLRAHLVAQLVALLRTAVLPALGLAVLFLTGQMAWFWIFEGAALLALLLLWPRRSMLRTLLGVPL